MNLWWWMSFLAGGLGVWFVRDALRAREAAIVAVRRACVRAGVQLLDETVELRELRPVRGRRGPVWRRRYGFEYTRDRETRSTGVLLMTGLHIELLVLAAPGPAEPAP